MSVPLCVKDKFTCRVSSTLDRNVSEYGKKYMFDDDNERCWQSDKGKSQSVIITFNEEVEVSLIKIQFQGGFAAEKAHIEAGPDVNNLTFVQDIYPEDVNSLQEFKLDHLVKATVFKIIFEDTTDFFGRIVIYSLNLYS
ncbi:unnamed protein product [Trichogramma brassicae]|uniref:F5/8 type C domain-containing protein n=1 Tax=Trichogramma brassicae TaxID=86971 RepID=A0A6H5IFS0_9HYME|nr:nuclear receptor 2C2-associated protein [Trichogramma pretiosum]CAB0037004.1 unnamed protein product [Trichogramma brassicae]